MGTRIKVHLSLFTVSLIYGATFSLAKEVMPHYISPFAFILLRVGVALLLFLAFHALFVRQKVDKKDLPGLALTALFGVAANMLMFFEGLAHTTPINAAVLMMVTPVFVFIISTALAKERPRPVRIVGLILATLGAAMLVGGRSFSFGKATLYGDVLVMLNALSYAVYLVYVKKYTEKYHPITVSKWNFVFGFFMVLPFGVGGLPAIQWQMFDGYIWFCVIFILLGTTFIAYLLNAWALKKAPATLVGAYIYLQPVIAAIIAVAAKKDEINTEKVIFILLIFTGVYLISLYKKPTYKE